MKLANMLSAATIVLGVLVLAGAAQAEPVKLRIGWIVPAGDAPLALFGKPGIAQHEGKSYTLEFTHFTGTPPMISAISADEVDLAPFAFSSFALAVENAKLEDLRIISDCFRDGVTGYYSSEYMVLSDSPIQKVEDLKGKVVTSNAAGSAVDIALREMLKRHGLQDKRDYTLIESAFPNMKSELLDRKVDLITGVTPFSQDPQLRAAARDLFVQKDAIGVSQMIIWTARTAFIAKNRAALVDYAEDYLRELRWYWDPANHADAVKAVTDFTKTPTALWDSWIFTKGDVYHDPNGMPDLDALHNNISAANGLGFVPKDLDPHQYADLTMVEEAAQRLK
ncbi:MAG TPA: ABC transporter substrate-binding protein [Stellaceae bacterium]|jgi:NitT/TauT family transport system substrate-binding protein|nr:ABC transporter substrate-binding protein [Stellaceae bacterium]